MKVLDWVVKKLLWIGFVSGAIGAWNRFYRCFESSREKSTLPRFSTMEELVGTIKGMKYTPDSWKELLDAWSSPEHIQWRYETQAWDRACDCDDFAFYEVEAVNGNKLGFSSPGVLSVMWRDLDPSAPRLGYGGHVVCLLLDSMGKWRYMDYGHPSEPVDTIREVANLVRGRYNPQRAVPLGYAMVSQDLRSVVFVEGR